MTKRDVYTSSGSSWSWTRSGTVWDDGGNSWSESWSKSSWKDGEYLPGEYEVTGGSFDPEVTGTEMNNLPEFGEAPRLNQPPKQEVPVDFQKPPKPSDDIWQLPTVIFKEPQFKEVFGSSGSDSPSGESGNDDLANNPSGGSGAPGGKLPENKRSALAEVIQQLLNFFRPLGMFVAGAVYQYLRNIGDSTKWLFQVFNPYWDGQEQDVERGLKGLPDYNYFWWGQRLGDGAAIVTGILEIIAGGGAAAGGGALCVAGLPCIGGAPAIVGGVALGLHGTTTLAAGVRNIVEELGIVFQSATGNGGGSSALNWDNWKSKPTFGHTFERHGQASKNTDNLRGRAAGKKQAQGQWLDNQKAAEFLRDLRPNIGDDPEIVDIPEGLGQLILPDGTIIPATRATVVPIPGGGYKTAFPIMNP
ncbi:hypothetical protein QUA46_28605 [Microcoleus sp. MON2_D6]|uniref:hypothetical protein n=1 Tax=Microcoleus sp. MON2_D6 TaxID=3055377 RepID=UPI002FD694A8